MIRHMTKQIVFTVTTVSLVFAAGCGNDATTGAAVGGLAGAGIGQLAGRSTEATLIGAAVGAGTGYFIGNESERRKTQKQMAAINSDVNSELVNVTNSNGSIIQVRLRRQGVGWVGPRGEYYPTLPTQEQLRPVYGF
jgi:outer membrane lipoprotein SlyB